MDGRLEEALEEIQQRNRRVEAQKAWETSFTRRAFIAGTTYLVAALYMHFGLAVENAPLHAFVPTGGYLLSTFSLPVIKEHWISRKFAKNP